MKKKIMIIVGILLVIGVVFVISSSILKSKEKTNQEVISGGKIDNTDYSAVKVINSKNIIGLDASFNIEHNDIGDDNYSGYYHFIVENGVLSEQQHFNMSEKIDVDVLNKVQTIIDDCKLVEMNGIDVYTAGLAPEYQASKLLVNYDSGEKLSFRKNCGSDAKWCIDLFDLFRQTFIELGHKELEPSKQAKTIIDFNFQFRIDDKGYEYFPVENLENVGIQLMKTTYDIDGDDSLIEVSDLDDDLFKQLENFISSNNLSRFHTGEIVSQEQIETTKDPYFNIYVNYENNKQLCGYSNDVEEVDDFIQEAKEIVDMFEEYMNTHGNHVFTW